MPKNTPAPTTTTDSSKKSSKAMETETTEAEVQVVETLLVQSSGGIDTGDHAKSWFYVTLLLLSAANMVLLERKQDKLQIR